VEPSRADKAVYGLGVLTAVLLSAAMLSQPTIATAADGDTATVAVPDPGSDTGLREPSISGPVVIHGTRPAGPEAAQSPNMRNQIPPPYLGFQRAHLYGSGWNTEYNSNGLSYTPWNPGQ
jgi:hypothetical protein